jgi:hypothetical protein
LNSNGSEELGFDSIAITVRRQLLLPAPSAVKGYDSEAARLSVDYIPDLRKRLERRPTQS